MEMEVVKISHKCGMWLHCRWITQSNSMAAAVSAKNAPHMRRARGDIIRCLLFLGRSRRDARTENTIATISKIANMATVCGFCKSWVPYSRGLRQATR